MFKVLSDRLVGLRKGTTVASIEGADMGALVRAGHLEKVVPASKKAAGPPLRLVK